MPLKTVYSFVAVLFCLVGCVVSIRALVKKQYWLSPVGSMFTCFGCLFIVLSSTQD